MVTSTVEATTNGTCVSFQNCKKELASFHSSVCDYLLSFVAVKEASRRINGLTKWKQHSEEELKKARRSYTHKISKLDNKRTKYETALNQIYALNQAILQDPNQNQLANYMGKELGRVKELTHIVEETEKELQEWIKTK